MFYVLHFQNYMGCGIGFISQVTSNRLVVTTQRAVLQNCQSLHLTPAEAPGLISNVCLDARTRYSRIVPYVNNPIEAGGYVRMMVIHLYTYIIESYSISILRCIGFTYVTNQYLRRPVKSSCRK